MAGESPPPYVLYLVHVSVGVRGDPDYGNKGGFAPRPVLRCIVRNRFVIQDDTYVHMSTIEGKSLHQNEFWC